jgi:WD40 repeat protein
LFLPLLGAATSGKLYVQATDHIEVLYYSPAHEYLVTHLIRSYENALAFERGLFHYTPSEKLSVLLEDFEDSGHGAAASVPTNFISIGIAPLSYTYETLPANERMTWIMNHESIHIVMGDNANGTDRRFRALFFGKPAPTDEDPVSMLYSSLASPRFYSTRWFHEGLAAFMETWMSGGLGRALGGYDEMVFRAMVRDDAYIYNVVGLESEGTSIDFQTGANSYLYGTRFMTWLSYTYGPDKLVEWTTRSDNTKRYFSARFAQEYGMPLEAAWNHWVEDERRWQHANLDAIRQYPVTVPERVSSKTLGSISRAYYDAGSEAIYVAVRYPGRLAHIAALHTRTGEIERLQDIKGAALYYVSSLAFDPGGRKLFYTTDNNNWRDLRVFDLATHRSRTLIKDARTGDLAFSQASGVLWGIRHSNGLSSLVSIAPPYTEQKLAHEFEYGSDIFDIDISPDGRYLIGALPDLSGRQKLVRFETEKLLGGDATFEVLHDFEYNTPGNFVYSPDGRYLYGSSYYTGVSNLFRYDIATGKMDAISNAETGLFRPLPLPDGSLVAFEYTSRGFVPARVPTRRLEDITAIKYYGMALLEKYPVLKSWKLPPPSSIASEKLITRAGSYQPMDNLRLISAYPIVQGYKDTAAGGVRVEIADRLRLAGVSLTASYSPDPSLLANERAHVSFDAHLWSWKLRGYYNNADFYDLFGPTKVSRKGYALELGHSKNLIFDIPRTLELTWNVAGYAGMDRLPDYQNVVATYHSLAEGNLGLKYSFLERSQGAVDDERGTQWGVFARLNYAGSSALPRFWANYDRGKLLPLRNSSVWIRAAAGKSYGDKTNPFANFYFGAFGNNYVDHGSINRYRDYYSFPGFGLDQLAANSFGRLMGEWNLPPVKFRHIGTTWLYGNWARLSLFSAGLATNFGSAAARNYYLDFGEQLDFRVVLFTYLNTTFSAGYAGATDRDGHVSAEYMLSLKIL